MMSTIGKTFIDLAGGPITRKQYGFRCLAVFIASGLFSALIVTFLPHEDWGASEADIRALSKTLAGAAFVVFSAQRAAHMEWPLLCSVLAWAPMTWIVFFPAFCIIPGKNKAWIPDQSIADRVLRYFKLKS